MAVSKEEVEGRQSRGRGRHRPLWSLGHSSRSRELDVGGREPGPQQVHRAPDGAENAHLALCARPALRPGCPENTLPSVCPVSAQCLPSVALPVRRGHCVGDEQRRKRGGGGQSGGLGPGWQAGLASLGCKVVGICVGKLGCTRPLIFEGADSAPPDAGHNKGLLQGTHRHGCRRPGPGGHGGGREPLILQQHLGCDRSSRSRSVIKVDRGHKLLECSSGSLSGPPGCGVAALSSGLSSAVPPATLQASPTPSQPLRVLFLLLPAPSPLVRTQRPDWELCSRSLLPRGARRREHFPPAPCQLS